MFAFEDDTLLESLAENLCAARGGGYYGDLTPDEREYWQTEVLQLMREGIKTEPQEPDPPPEPGSSTPVRVTRIA